MNASQLKQKYLEHNPEGFHFAKMTMKFFGDTMSNYYVPVKPVQVELSSGEVVECWSLTRRKATKLGLKTNAYFCVKTFSIIHGDQK